MKLETLRDLYVEQLRDLYSAENQLVKALPKMAKGASNTQLQQAFTDHLAQTQQHVQRSHPIAILLMDMYWTFATEAQSARRRGTSTFAPCALW